MIKNKLSRRSLILRSAVATTAAALGTRGTPAFARTGKAPAEVTSSAAATNNGTLVTTISADQPGLDPCNPWFLGLVGNLDVLPYDNWTIYDRNSQLRPYLAKSVTRVDPTTVIYEIRPGVLFHHTGRELTATDVVANAKRFTTKSLGCSNSGLYSSDVAALTAIDKYRFKVKLSVPNLLVDRLNLPPAIDPTYVARNAHPVLLRDEAGTGPWILTDWVPGASMTFQRNPTYWRNPPKLGVVRFQIIPDENVAVLALKTGQINFLSISKYQSFAQVQEDPRLNAWATPSSSYIRLNVNHLRPALQDPNVLQALRYGINRQQMVQVLTHGLGKVSGPVTPANPFYALPDAELATLQKYDPKLAMSYMHKAGYNLTDKRLKLVCLSIASVGDATDLVQIAAANLKQIGIDLEIKIQETGVWVNSRIKTKDYDLSWNGNGNGPVPDLTWLRSDQAEQDWTGGKDANLDKLINAMNIEQDPLRRRELCRQIQRLLITHVRELYLYAAPVFEAASKKLVGYKPWPGGTDYRAFTLDQVYLQS